MNPEIENDTLEKDRVIAMDGPSGVGKSSVAKDLASGLDGWFYLDTGAMYRAITWAWLQTEQNQELLTDHTWLNSLDLYISDDVVEINGCNISKEIRSRDVTAQVSLVSSMPEVRRRLTAMQQEIGHKGRCVLDGRDIGTVVFPNAFLKVYLIASPEIRARRRWLQLGGEQSPVSLEQLIEDLKRRDEYDSSRALAPLKPAWDAWMLSTDNLNKEQVTQKIREEALKRLGNQP